MDAGMHLLHSLATDLSIPGWNPTNLEVTYTAEEMEAIDTGLHQFQKTANRELGEGAEGEAVFHPDIVPELQRGIAFTGLLELADAGWRFEDELLQDWKLKASTYLKAWASSPQPVALNSLGELLVRAREFDHARAVFQVVLLFPEYAPKLYSVAKAHELTEWAVETARSGLRNLEASASSASGQ